MSSLVDAPIGAQQPRVSHWPQTGVSSAGQEAVELAALAGLELDAWQQLVLEASLSERADGKWAAFEVGLVVSRQNGKGGVLEARELAGLFLLGERLIIHSAHQFDTSLEAFRRLYELIEAREEFSRRVKRVSRSHGEEGIEFTNGQRIRYRTRTRSGGRGYTGDLVIFDEAMDLPEAVHGAVLPVVSAMSMHGNPQIWYTGSAVDQLTHDHGVVFSRIRERGLAGDPSLAYFEWSTGHVTPDDIDDDAAASVESWAQANPALGIRISAEHVGNERRSLDARRFAVERLGVGDWPQVLEPQTVIPMDAWRAGEDRASQLVDPVSFCFDVSPQRTQASISAAGRRADGLPHIEVVARGAGTGWIAPWLRERVPKWRPKRVVYDEASPAAAIAAELSDAGVRARGVNSSDHAAACGMLFDLVEQGKLCHLGQRELEQAVKGASQRPLGERWAWSRRSSAVDITPLVSATLALWAALTAPAGQAVGFV